MMQKTWQIYWSPGIWVLIWEYSVRAIQWIPTWHGLDGFQKSLCPCALDEDSLKIGRVNYLRLLTGNAYLHHPHFIMKPYCLQILIDFILFLGLFLIILTFLTRHIGYEKDPGNLQSFKGFSISLLANGLRNLQKYSTCFIHIFIT